MEFLNGVEKVLNSIDGIVWGPPLLILLVGTGIYFTFKLKLIQVFKLPLALKYLFVKDDEEGNEEAKGDVSSFAALCTALSATIGTGNIVGVATAIAAGGPGALFWMWIAAFFGMATKYAEGVLAIKYREVDENGQMSGGPMYYIEKGLGNKFLSHIRETDAIVEVVRCFEDSNVVHVDGSVNPIRDIETINLELIFADIETVNKRLDKARKNLKADKKYQEEIDLLEKILKVLEEGKSARTIEFNEDEQVLVKDMFLLTTKPILYVANVSEDQLEDAENDELVKQVKEYASTEKAEVIPLCVKIEEELSVLDEDDEKEMLEALGLEESGLNKVIKKSYDLLGLMSFLTAGEPEVRAWTIKKGTKAPQAAGKIHTDFERGFIRAEVVHFDDLMNCGSMSAAKEKGLVRSEGKEYVMKDGDIVLFRFNV